MTASLVEPDNVIVFLAKPAMNVNTIDAIGPGFVFYHRFRLVRGKEVSLASQPGVPRSLFSPGLAAPEAEFARRMLALTASKC
jgi:hypothetical protein